MVSIKGRDAIIDAAYEAALDPSVWQRFIRTYMNAIGGDCATLMHVNTRQTKMSLVHDFSIDPYWRKAYQNYFVTVDVRVETARRLRKIYPVMTDQVLSTYVDYYDSEFYHDYSLPQKRKHFIGFGVESSAGWRTTLASQRTASQGQFDDDHITLHNLIKPHIERALLIHTRFAGLSARGSEIEASMDRLPHGVILLDDSGVILHANTNADEVFAAGDGLRVQLGRLETASTSQTQALNTLINDVIAGGPGGAIPLARPSPRRPLHIVVAPLRHADDFAHAKDSAVMVFVTDPERHPKIPTEHLRALFGFSAAESRLAQHFVKGQSVRQISISLSVKEDTVRKTLKSMYQKTHTGRQAELVVLLLSAASLN